MLVAACTAGATLVPQFSAAADRTDDGELPSGITAFDEQYAGVALLDPELLHALREASSAAALDDVDIFLTSGWRSPDYQQRLLDDAVTTYGSLAEASRWVATPETSQHVSGAAVDVAGADAASWLSIHGATYGLCQIYGNEAWHFELRPSAAQDGCPATYIDPSYDPRLQR